MVLLSGETPTEDLKIRANAIAAKSTQVKKVFNEITIGAPSSMLSRSSDSYITAKVKIALLRTPGENFDSTHIKVVSENGAVFLMGLVTEEEANIATEKASGVSGVQKVVKLFEYIEKQTEG